VKYALEGLFQILLIFPFADVIILETSI